MSALAIPCSIEAGHGISVVGLPSNPSGSEIGVVHGGDQIVEVVGVDIAGEDMAKEVAAGSLQ